MRHSKLLAIVSSVAVITSVMVGCGKIDNTTIDSNVTSEVSDILVDEENEAAVNEVTPERDTKVNILLPPDYTEDKEYPVVYILHRYYDNEDWMARPIVGISTMLSNLYTNGEAEEMIVVVPYIYCSKDMPYCTGDGSDEFTEL